MKSLISFDGLGDAIDKLIDKLSDAVGWVATHSTPQREALSTYIREIQESDFDLVTKAALISTAKKTIKEFTNQSEIVQNALQFMKPSARPEDVDSDWLAQFMDKARLVSDADFRLIWGRILAEECNAPNSIPKGLLHVLEQMDKQDASNFTTMCSVSVKFVDNKGTSFSPVILYGEHEDFYDSIGLEFEVLVDLQSIGLIDVDISDDSPYLIDRLVLPAEIRYHDQSFLLPEGKDTIHIGCVLFTRIGEALCKAITSEKREEFFEEYCIPFWEKMGFDKDTSE